MSKAFSLDVARGQNVWDCGNLEKDYAQARSTPPKLEKPARKVGGEAPTFGALFLSFGGVERARA